MLFLGGAIYFVLAITCGVLTFRKHHYFLFWLGIVLPFLWLIGAVMAPAVDYETGTG
jgi:ABC-type multidrug transport system permease subunit